MQNQLLLLEDVYNLGRKGDIVKAKPGFVRNFLLPKKKAVVATKQALKIREKLQEERAKQAAEDKVIAEKLAQTIEGKVLETTVKVDRSGHMYGSVSASDLVKLFDAEGLELDKHNLVLPHPLKKLGNHRIDIKLKEGVMTHIFVKVKGEGLIEKVEKPKAQEDSPEAEEKTEELSE